MLQELDNNKNQQNQFNILLDEYEGPIDLLLNLARKQKVNLSNISVLKLAEQYIDFITNYKEIHLEVAADYLVMAAWLTYLKSRLLLPKVEKTDDYSPEDLEYALKFQLERLESMQKLSKNLYSRPLIDRDIFYGSSDRGLKIKYNISYTSSLFDILKTYSNILSSNDKASSLTISSSELHSVDEAIQRITEMFGSIKEWTNIMKFIPKFGLNNLINKSLITSNFVASLELAKNGIIEVRQNEAFGNIFIKYKS